MDCAEIVSQAEWSDRQEHMIRVHSAYEESVLGRYQSFNDPKKYLSKLSGPEQNETLLALARAVAKVFQQ